jgi:hypothetical protein
VFASVSEENAVLWRPLHTISPTRVLDPHATGPMRRPVTMPIVLAPVAASGQRPADRRLPGVLGRYLTGVFVLTTLVLVTAPAAPSERPNPTAASALERIQIDGGGINTLTRTGMRATAWTTAHAIQRQRDLLAPNPLATRLLAPLATRLNAWRALNADRLAWCAMTAVAVLVGYGVLGRPRSRTWALMLLLLLAWTVAATRPQATLHAAQTPGLATSRLAVALVGPHDHDERPAVAQAKLGDQFWTAFVTQPFSRVQTGSSILAQAPPEQRTGLLGLLGRQVAELNQRMLGGHSLERALIATLALLATLPFAAAVAACAMAAWLAQILLLLLCLASLVTVPLLLDRHSRPLLVRWWLRPLAGALALTAVATLASIGVTELAVALAGAGEAVARLLTGAAFAALFVALTGWSLRRWARRLTHADAATTTAGRPAQADQPNPEASVA